MHAYTKMPLPSQSQLFSEWATPANVQASWQLLFQNFKNLKLNAKFLMAVLEFRVQGISFMVRKFYLLQRKRLLGYKVYNAIQDLGSKGISERALARWTTVFVLSATVHEKIVALNLWDSVHSGRGSTFCIRDLGDRTQKKLLFF